MSKPKIIVIVTEGGVTEIHSTNPEAFDVVLIDKAVCDAPYVGVGFNAYEDSVSDFNDTLEGTIESIQEAVDDFSDEAEFNSDVEEWKDQIEALEAFKVK